MFETIGRNEKNWDCENLYGEKTFQKENETHYCLIRELAFGRYLLQYYPIEECRVLKFTTLDQPDENGLRELFELGEEWLKEAGNAERKEPIRNIAFELRGDEGKVIQDIKNYIPIEREDIWSWLCYFEDELKNHQRTKKDKR